MTRLRFLLILSIVTLAGLTAMTATGDDVRWSGQRVPLGILLTNWDCGPCAPANQYLDNYIPTQGNDVALIRVHVWWPGNDDPIYLANESQARFLADNTPNGGDYAPHLWLDNIVDAGSNGAGYEAHFEARKLITSPLEISVNYDIVNDQAHATVHVLDAMPTGDYRLYTVLTEDNVFAEGTNEEPIHNQAFRRMYPDTDGLPVVNAVGDQDFIVDTPRHFRWVFEELRATVYVQETGSGEVINTGTMFISEGTITTGVSDETPTAALRLDAAPNPFNPQTTLRFAVQRSGSVTLRVYDLAGRLVETLVDGDLPAGEHTAIWHGRSDDGTPVNSGVYVARIEADGVVSTRKLVLTK